MKEEQRRRIARRYLEETFGKHCLLWLDVENERPIYGPAFELWRDYDSMEKGTFEARAFEVIYRPYMSSSSKPIIIVSDNEDELYEIAKKAIPEDRMKYGYPEFDTYKGYYIMFD